MPFMSLTPLYSGCVYFQIDATLDAYIKPDIFEQIPMEPNNMVKTGKEVFLVSKQEGRIASVPGVDVIRGLASFRCVFFVSRSPWGFWPRGALSISSVPRLGGERMGLESFMYREKSSSSRHMPSNLTVFFCFFLLSRKTQTAKCTAGRCGALCEGLVGARTHRPCNTSSAVRVVSDTALSARPHCTFPGRSR